MVSDISGQKQSLEAVKEHLLFICLPVCNSTRDGPNSKIQIIKCFKAENVICFSKLHQLYIIALLIIPSGPWNLQNRASKVWFTYMLHFGKILNEYCLVQMLRWNL